MGKPLTLPTIDRGWPYQVAILAVLSEGHHADEQALYCNRLLRCSVVNSIAFEDQIYKVHCFATRAGAEAFISKFGGEWFDPRERGRGVNADRWLKGSRAHSTRGARP